ncbi:MAG: hypothetical protein V1708_06110 [Candidatus Micrarchaeota archaeon]
MNPIASVERTIFVKELNCDSCERVIRRITGRHQVQVKAVDFTKNEAQVEGGEEGIRAAVESLNANGYAASLERMPQNSRVKEKLLAFAAGTVFGREGYAAESRAFEVVAYSFVLLAGATMALGWMKIFPLTGPLAYYAALSAFGTALIAGIAWQVKAYGDSFTHMNGMMVGMTIGMAAGFLAGAIVGAVNGMFIGSIVGMAAGMLVGAYLGYCCGVMGVLEGLMGGVMAGTMGAMLSVMMVFDHLNEFLAILFACFAAIIAGLAYMIRKENAGLQPSRPDLGPCLAASLAAQAIVLFVISYGPRAIAGAIGGK